MEEHKYNDQYASLTEYQNFQLIDNEENSDESDVEMNVGRGRKTANDLKQWLFVVKKTKKANNLVGNEFNDTNPFSNDIPQNESLPLLNENGNANDALNALHQAQSRATLEMDVRATDLHMSSAELPSSIPSSPHLDFIYVGIGEKRMKYWCDNIEYQLEIEPNLVVEWLLMIDNQLAIATNNKSVENRQFNLQCWKDLYIRYYSQYVSEHIYKFYRKYGYGYDAYYDKNQFHLNDDDNIYSRDISRGSIFREIDRIRMTRFAFQQTLSLTMQSGYMSQYPIDEMNKRILDKNNVLIDALPCHQYDILSDIYKQIWSTIRFTNITTLFQIPLSAIRDYYGEKLTFYFLFICCYTRYLIPIASVGFFFQIYQFTNNDVEVELIGFFAILVLIWGALVPLLWRQNESRYACKWGQYSNETSDPQHLENTHMDDFSNMAKVKKGKIHYIFEPEMERVEFKGEPKRSTIDGAVIKKDDQLDRIRGYIVSYSMLLLILTCIAAVSITIIIMEFFVMHFEYLYGEYIKWCLGVINAICMLIFEQLSYKLIPILNNRENHRTNIQHKKGYFIKRLIFDIFNYYISLLFIVFVVPLTSLHLSFVICNNVNCLTEIQSHFGSLYCTLIVCRLCTELYAFTCGKYSYRVMKRVPSTAYFQPFYDIQSNMVHSNIIPPARKPELNNNEYLLYKYIDNEQPQLSQQRALNEFIIQFGYIVTFGLFFPWCAPLSLVYNLLILRLELHKLTCYCRRPFPEGANGLAPYNTTLKIISYLSIFVVFYTFTVDSFELRLLSVSQSQLFQKILSWFLLIIIFSIFYLVILWLFPSVPSSVSDHIKRQMFIDQSISINYDDMKSYQESLTISALLKLKKWNVQQVHDYFNGYGHPRYTLFAKISLRKDINGDKLLNLNENNLKEYGIKDKYHRMWIQEEIESLKSLHRHISYVYNKNNANNVNNSHLDENLDTVRAFMRYKKNKESWQYKKQQHQHIKNYDLNTSSIINDIDDDDINDDNNDIYDDNTIKDDDINIKIVSNVIKNDNVNNVSDNDNDSDNESDNVSDNNINDNNDNDNDNYKSLHAQIAKEKKEDLDKSKSSLSSGIVLVNNDNDNDNNNDVIDNQNKLLSFGSISIGILTTKATSSKNIGDSISMRDIIFEFESIIKPAARIKLIKSFASKKLKVSEIKNCDQIHSLLELIILLIIKLKYKNNVNYDKTKFKNALNDFVQWIVYDKNNMNAQIWDINDFAQTFDNWIKKILL